jgi:universal stress protein A
MSAQGQVARYIVVAAIDSSEQAEAVADAAASIVERVPLGELHLVHVLQEMPGFDPLVPLPPSMGPELMEAGRAVLERAAAAARGRCGKDIRAHLLVGVPWQEVVHELRDLEADLAVVGTHDRTGISRLVLGSVAEQILRHAPCPALVVRPKEPSPADAIETLCPDCDFVRGSTSGQQRWCARHAAHRPHHHLHYSVPPSFGVGSMFVRP